MDADEINHKFHSISSFHPFSSPSRKGERIKCPDIFRVIKRGENHERGEMKHLVEYTTCGEWKPERKKSLKREEIRDQIE